MKFLKRFPFHSFLLAAYPVIALLGHNIQEMDPWIAIRPTIIALAGSLILLILLYLGLRDWRKAGLVTSFLLVILFSYGHLYEFLQTQVFLGVSPGRHRYLVPVIAIIMLVGLWLIIKKVSALQETTQLLNVIALALFIYPLFQIIDYYRGRTISEQAVEGFNFRSDQNAVQNANGSPDIYYIILDAYTRSDALQDDLSFDNTQFLNELKAMGFYVASCSRSNYAHTHLSLASTLNLNYLHKLALELKQEEFSNLGVLIKKSRVRKLLESLDYSIVAFENGYDHSRLYDADIFLGPGKKPLMIQAINPFESLLIRSTVGLIYTDWQLRLQINRVETVNESVININFPFESHTIMQRFILDTLPQVPSLPGPKFVFAHIAIPHFPYVFKPNGEIQENPNFYHSSIGRAFNDEFDDIGYVNQIQYINSRILPILETILEFSEKPPIIILQGDHGLKGDNRYEILNAYYLPENDYSKLTPHITPINSFRFIFDTYFNTSYGFLPDESYTEENTLVPETSPSCIPSTRSPFTVDNPVSFP